MNRLEPTRQESIRVWADAQRKALHEAVRNTPVAPPAQAAAGTGVGAGGSFETLLDLDTVLQLLNANYSTITDVVESGRLYYFNDDGDGDCDETTMAMMPTTTMARATMTRVR